MPYSNTYLPTKRQLTVKSKPVLHCKSDFCYIFQISTTDSLRMLIYQFKCKCVCLNLFIFGVQLLNRQWWRKIIWGLYGESISDWSLQCLSIVMTRCQSVVDQQLSCLHFSSHQNLIIPITKVSQNTVCVKSIFTFESSYVSIHNKYWLLNSH